MSDCALMGRRNEIGLYLHDLQLITRCWHSQNKWLW